MLDKIFEICVDFLYILADITGLSYKEINVIIFCFIWPIITIRLTIIAIKKRKNKIEKPL